MVWNLMQERYVLCPYTHTRLGAGLSCFENLGPSAELKTVFPQMWLQGRKEGCHMNHQKWGPNQIPTWKFGLATALASGLANGLYVSRWRWGLAAVSWGTQERWSIAWAQNRGVHCSWRTMRCCVPEAAAVKPWASLSSGARVRWVPFLSHISLIAKRGFPKMYWIAWVWQGIG